MMRRNTGRCVRHPATRHTTHSTVQRTASTGVTPCTCTKAVARNRLGSVTESAAAVTTGAATSSRSQSLRTLSVVVAIVIAITTMIGMIPPSTDTTTKSAIEIAWVTPNATAKPFATIASRNANDIDSATADARFWPTSVSMRHDHR